MDVTDFRKTIDKFKSCGYDLETSTVHISIPHAKENLHTALSCFVKNLVWLPEYDEIATWLQDNKKKGLLCMGNLGRGKTLICTKAIPVLINHYSNLLVTVVSAYDLNDEIDKVKHSHLLCIDDIGIENEYFRYGEHRNPFAEIVDLAEKKGNLLILTTNLRVDEITSKYGERTLDRLHAIVKVVKFCGESQRR